MVGPSPVTITNGKVSDWLLCSILASITPITVRDYVFNEMLEDFREMLEKLLLNIHSLIMDRESPVSTSIKMGWLLTLAVITIGLVYSVTVYSPSLNWSGDRSPVGATSLPSVTWWIELWWCCDNGLFEYFSCVWTLLDTCVDNDLDLQAFAICPFFPQFLQLTSRKRHAVARWVPWHW